MAKFDPAPKPRVLLRDYWPGFTELLALLAGTVAVAVTVLIGWAIWYFFGWLVLGVVVGALALIGWIRERPDEFAIAVGFVVMAAIVVAAIVGIGYLLGIGMQMAR